MRKFCHSTVAAIALSIPLTVAGLAFAADRATGLEDDQWAREQVGLLEAVSLGSAEMGELRGAGFLSNLLAALPEGNSIHWRINDSPQQTQSGPGPQTFAGSNGTSFSLRATNEATASPPPPPIISFTDTSSRSRTRTHSFSISIGW